MIHGRLLRAITLREEWKNGNAGAGLNRRDAKCAREDQLTGMSALPMRRCLNVERDPLRQRQLLRVVDRIRRSPHVGLPGVGAGFAAASGLLFAAERAADLGAAGAD